MELLVACVAAEIKDVYLKHEIACSLRACVAAEIVG